MVAVEDDLRAVHVSTIQVVGPVLHVGVHDSVGVDGMPAVADHADGEGLVAEAQGRDEWIKKTCLAWAA